MSVLFNHSQKILLIKPFMHKQKRMIYSLEDNKKIVCSINHPFKHVNGFNLLNNRTKQILFGTFL